MHDSPLSKKGVIASLIIALLFLFIAFLKQSGDSFVVFCDVGQGDASYIHISPNIDILIDAGKDSSVLSCIGKYMPISDHKIELAFISHFQNDHYGGYINLLKHYQIDQMIISSPAPDSPGVSRLLKALRERMTNIHWMFAGDSIEFDGGKISMIWPTKDYSQSSRPNNDPNNLSQVMVFSTKNHSILYTGDASSRSLDYLSEQAILKVDILKVPHHGSKNGLNRNFLLLADPTYALISSGINNSYGHPSAEILEMLEANNVNILRTDQNGHIRFSLE